MLWKNAPVRPVKIDLPDPELVSTLLSQYAPVRLDVAVDHLAEPDRRALAKLVEAASWIDRIFWKQRSEEGWQLKQEVAATPGDEARRLERLLDINFGPWDGFKGNQPFWRSGPRPPGGNFYPPDLTRAELTAYLTRHPDQRTQLLSHTTLVRRRGDRFVALPYENAYKDELAQVARCLVEASERVTHAGFRAFLQARARDLVEGDLTASEARWIGVADSPVDIAIGPYEVYDDQLMGLKASYEATVVVRHPMTERLTQFESVAGELEERLPGAVAPSASRRKFAIGVYDVVSVGGMTNMGVKAVAATLPNDERIRTEVGARLLLFRNVASAKVEPILKPLSARLLHPEQLALVSEDAFVAHTLLHEMAHAVTTGFLMEPQRTPGGARTANEALRERYSTIEECRADLLGLVFLDQLTRRGMFPPQTHAAAAVTFVANTLRTLRFGMGEDHSRGSAIILSSLLRQKAVWPDGDDRLRVDVEGVHRGAAELAERVHAITVRGDYDAAGALIDDLGSMPAEVARLVPRLREVPVDIEFVFDDSLRLR